MRPARGTSGLRDEAMHWDNTAAGCPVGLHGIAAPFQRHLMRDSALLRMLPWGRPGRRDRNAIHSSGELQ